MGKSFENDIKISDSEEITTKKIMKALTDTNRIKLTDAGNPDNCAVVYEYWKIFDKDDKIKEIENDCKNANIGCSACKKELARVINDSLAPIRQKRIELEKDENTVKDILSEGSKKAKVEAQAILDQVEKIIKMY